MNLQVVLPQKSFSRPRDADPMYFGKISIQVHNLAFTGLRISSVGTERAEIHAETLTFLVLYDPGTVYPLPDKRCCLICGSMTI